MRQKNFNIAKVHLRVLQIRRLLFHEICKSINPIQTMLVLRLKYVSKDVELLHVWSMAI